MEKLLISILIFLISVGIYAQTSSDPIPPVQAVNMLGKGMLFEPQAGSVDFAISAPYKPKYGQLLKDSGFKSVRIRYQGSKNPMMKAITEGAPYDAADQALIDELKGIVDDLLSKDLAVVITFFGVDGIDDGDGTTDLQKMKDWWSFVAENFKNYDHRVIFNLFVEPYTLWKNVGETGVRDYYKDLTDVIRTTNPTRIIVYFAIPPTPNDDPFGPGENNFITKTVNLIPESAGIYYMWDFHVLKNNTRDNIRLVEQASEYRDSAKQSVWSGAWYSTSSDIPQWLMKPMATNTNRRFIDRGIPYAYLMMFDGHTGIYDAQNDRNENGVLEEWTYPGLDQILVTGPDVWWNLLSNPGFENDTAKWKTANGKFSIAVTNEDHHLMSPAQQTAASLIQDVTLSLKNNGQGKYNALCYVKSSGSTDIKFILKGSAGGTAFSFESSTVTVSSNNNQIVNEPIDISFTGDIDNAEFLIELTGDAAEIDKTGLTMFFYENPELDISLWPGEKINNDNYSSKSNSGQDINGKLRELTKDEVANNNPDIIPITDKIHDIRIQLEDRLKTLISQDYAYTTDETQYRTGGYYYGSANKQYRSSVDKYIGGKDQQATDLNNQLTDQQDLATKYFVLNDLEFRELYYDVFRDYPEFIKQEIQVDTTVTVDGGTLTAAQGGASYRWLDCNLLNNPVSGATGQSFKPKMPGIYAVEITKDGFVMQSGCHEIKEISGIWNKHQVYTTRIYPNPARDYVVIEPENEQQPFTATLLDIQGRVIETFINLNPVSARIKTDNLSKGIYFLDLKFNDKNEIFKVLIE